MVVRWKFEDGRTWQSGVSQARGRHQNVAKESSDPLPSETKNSSLARCIAFLATVHGIIIILHSNVAKQSPKTVKTYKSCRDNTVACSSLSDRMTPASVRNMPVVPRPCNESF